MSRTKRTSKEESFAQSYIKHFGDLLKAYKGSEYSQKLTNVQMSVEASKLSKKPIIALRIEELEGKVRVIAEKKFTITVERRLRWLSEIVEAGMGDYIDASGGKRKENLAAAKGAIETLNNMLGTKEENDNIIKPIAIGIVDAS